MGYYKIRREMGTHVMPRARGNDLCEIFGYAPDDTSDNARKQWKSQECPFVSGVCIKHSHPQDGKVIVYGTCSVTNYHQPISLNAFPFSC